MRATRLLPASSDAVDRLRWWGWHVVIATCLMLAMPASATRILVMPLGNDADPSMSAPLGRSVEAAVQDAAPTADVVTASSLGAAVELEAAKACLGIDVENNACMTELVGASNAELVVRGHLGRLGDTYVLTFAILDGASARLLAQGQRLVAVERPSDLVEVTPGLVRQVLRDSRSLPVRPEPQGAPVGPIIGTVAGVTLVGLGATSLIVWGVASDRYNKAELSREEAQTFELFEAPLVSGGAGLVVVGGAVAVIGTAMLVSALRESE